MRGWVHCHVRHEDIRQPETEAHPLDVGSSSARAVEHAANRCDVKRRLAPLAITTSLRKSKWQPGGAGTGDVLQVPAAAQRPRHAAHGKLSRRFRFI